ncbi:MAG: alpha/beta fold hydrolase [Myxococcales bacterium]|nr:alpha/beta fold hydrolase [Myxococcales bacterium]
MKTLAYTLVSADGAASDAEAGEVDDDARTRPARWMVFLHGILGTRANWRTIARRFCEARPEWGAVLVDLREHGDSLGFPPPHTVAACAADLDDLATALASGGSGAGDAPGDVRIAGALGHSFGGKVALAWAQRRDARGEPLDALWLIDSCPGPRPLRESDEPLRVLSLLERLSFPMADLATFKRAVIDAGFSEPLAAWLALNLERLPSGERALAIDPSAIRALLEDYGHLDLWPAFEHPPRASVYHAVVAGRSDVYAPSDLERARRAAAADPHVRVDLIPEAGHSIHVDAPGTLLGLLAET